VKISTELRRISVSEMRVGMKGVKEMVVSPQDLASVLGNIGADVLSTHRVVLLMEQASRNAIEKCVPDKSMTVGTMINIRHLAATPLGRKVRAEAYLKRVDGRRMLFDVAAYDEFEKIAEGENEHLLVSVDRFLERVQRKTSKARSI
jgi:fluoroacetyl-CoA thioesterase